MDLRNTPTGKGLAAIYRQEIIQDVTLFTFQSAAMFYDKLFSSLDFTLPRAATGRRGFPKEAMVCAFIVMKCEGFSQITDLADYLDNNRLIAHYSRVGGLYIWNCVEWSIYIIGLMNSTPLVRQYDILSNRWGDLLCQEENQTNDTRQNLRSWSWKP